MMSISTRFAALMVTGALVMGVGCASMDRHTFNSTIDRPVTVSVVDTTNDQTVWSKAVPPGERLVLDLDHSSSTDNPFTTSGVPANNLSWKTFPLESRSVVRDSGKARLPGTPVILNVTYTKPVVPAAVETSVEASPAVGDTQETAEPVETPAPQPEPAAIEEAPAAEEPVEQPAAVDAPAQAPAAADAPTAADAQEDTAATEAAEDAAAEEPIMFK